MYMEEEEDEIHFILHRPVYHDLRLKYLAPFDSPPNVNTFCSPSYFTLGYFH